MSSAVASLGHAPRFLVAASLVATLLLAGVEPAAAAPSPAMPASAPFDLVGVLQAASLDDACASDPHCGGKLTVGDRVVLVPRETVLILPTSALTWQELFAQAPAPYAPSQTGLASADSPAPAFPSEVHVVGNRVGDTSIAGLIDIAPGGPARGSGSIAAIDYATGELRIVATEGAAGTRVRLNDPTGRFGRAGSADPRFTVDPAAASVAAATGFPMCIPRSNPDVADDPNCPQGNRPADFTGGFAKSIQMNDPSARPGIYPDATRQAPLEVGDRVTYAGTLATDAAGPFVSAYRIDNSAAIYTWPGTSPAYVSVDAGLVGAGSLTVIGAREDAVRTTFEGMTSDPSRGIHLYGIDVNPATGEAFDRDWGSIGVDPGPPTGAEKGRWRFREPCLPFGSVPTGHDTQCVYGPDGIFLPPTREVRAVIEGLGPRDQASTGPNADSAVLPGEAHYRIGRYVFPNAAPDWPPAPNAFESLPFLACGGFTSSGGTRVGRLDPWPGVTPPTCPGPPAAASCPSPVASTGGPYTVGSGSTVSLAGSATGTPPPTLVWATPLSGTIADATAGTTTFTAPTVAATTTLNLSLTATNGCGSDIDTTTVTVNAALPPTVGETPSISVVSGQSATLTVPGSDQNSPPLAPLIFTADQRGTPALRDLTVRQDPPHGSRVTFTAPTLPTDQAASSTVTLTIKAANSLGQLSAGRTVTVTVLPAPDRVTITGARYRKGARQLEVTARSSFTASTVALTLLPYVTRTGSTYTPPDGSFVNRGDGRYALTLVGAPRPAAGRSLRVVSSLGGRSPAHAVTRAP
jgi:hypothetical protein